jgi:hypothetical protein
MGGSIALYLTRAVEGPGFVPGLLTASPLAAAGLVGITRVQGQARLVGAMAVLPVPVVWMTQYQGGAIPQWGGRYLLASGLVLAVVGVAALARVQPFLRVTLVALSLGVTVFGLAWMVERTHAFADAVADVERVPTATVIVSELAHLAREGGGTYGGHRWLTASRPGDLRRASLVARAAGAQRVDVVSLEDRPSFIGLTGYRLVATRRVPILEFHLTVRSYRAS